MRKAIIIQARTDSVRLPGKVLKKLSGKPLLWHIIERVKKVSLINEIIIATTDRKEDIPITELAQKSGVKFFTGSVGNVLDRYYQCTIKYEIELIVRITGDCPVIDPKVIDAMIKNFMEENFDYMSNSIIPSYPDGLDTEVFSFSALKKAWKESKNLSEKEHVTSYIWNHPEIFKIKNVGYSQDLSYMRWCVDEERDLRFIKEIYKRLYKKNEIFYMDDILSLLKQCPKLLKINTGILRNEGYAESLKGDINTYEKKKVD